MNAIWVFLGGGIGAVIRYLISIYTPSQTLGFPWATFIANVFACIILAGVVWAIPDMSSRLKLLLATGLCGGLSTFSTFSLETFNLLEQGQISMAIFYVLASVLICLLVMFCLFYILR